MKPWAVRWQLTIWNSAVLAALFVLFGLALLSAVHAHLVHQADEFMMEELHELIEELRGIDDSQVLSDQLTPHYSVHSHFHFQVLDATGTPIFRSRFLSDVKLPTPASAGEMRGPQYEDIELPVAGDFRLLSLSIRNSRSEPLLLQVVTPRAALRQEFRWYLGTLLTVLPVTLVVSVVTGYLLAGRALQPLQHMASVANRISAENLDQRLEVRNSHDELGRLATTLNGMFDRLQSSMKQMRQFTSDAAHELRSPIAALRTHSEVALRSARTPEEYRCVVQVTLDEATRMSQLVDQLLLLSRHDSGQKSTTFEESRVDLVLLDVIERFHPLATERGLNLHVQSGVAWLLNGDDIWLSQLFWNLLDNASKYTERGGEIFISTGLRTGRWFCIVRDTGIGIATHHLPHLFDRFYRVDSARTPTAGGMGLGLAICKSIAESHGGTLQVTSQVDIGTEFTLLLPGVPAKIDEDEQTDSSSDGLLTSEAR